MNRGHGQMPRSLGRRNWIVVAISALAGCGGGSATTDASSLGGTSASPDLSGSGSGGSSSGGTTNSGSGGSGASNGAGTTSGSNGGSQVASAPGTGGTGSGAQGSLPGTGGTGVFSQGSISAFGSVVINGIHYDESGARIRIDGAASNSGALRLGMVAGIQGEKFSDGLTGRADSIDVWSIARGVVTSVGSGAFTVLGMRIQTTGSTFLEGLGSAAGIAIGQTVEVWGLQANAQASAWSATRVAVGSAGGAVVATGIVDRSGGHRSLNGVPLSGQLARGLSSGDVVRVLGTWDSANAALVVSSVHPLDTRGAGASTGKVVEIEGVVTSLQGGRRFTLGSVQVDGSALGSRADGLHVGAKIEVSGTWQGQTLVASKLELEDD